MSTQASTSGYGMHITIPDAKIERDHDGKQYHAFNIYVNAHYHASTRYRELRRIHERLTTSIGFRVQLPEFPPKRILSLLNENQLAERRVLLQAYFQAVLTHPLCDSARQRMRDELLRMQVASFRPTTQHLSLDVYTADGKMRIAVKCAVSDGSNTVLRHYAEAAHLSPELLKHFALFLVAHSQDDTARTVTENCVKMLHDYESPYITLQVEAQRQSRLFRLVVLRWCFEPSIEQQYLLNDVVAVNIIAAQCNQELHEYDLNESDARRLAMLYEQGRNLEFVRECHTLTNYGLWRLANCTVSIGETMLPCRLYVGRRIIRVISEQKGESVVDMYRITRIRMWKLDSKDTYWTDSLLNFEYLSEPGLGGRFYWISLQTRQASLLSNMLHAITTGTLMVQRHTTRAQEPTHATNGTMNHPQKSSTSSSMQVLASNGITAAPHEESNRVVVTTKPPLSNGANEQRYETLNEVLTHMGSGLLGAQRRQQRLEQSRLPQPITTTNATFNSINDDDL